MTNKEQPTHLKETGKLVFGPREETIRLLCQLARAYRFEPGLAQGLCSYIAN